MVVLKDMSVWPHVTGKLDVPSGIPGVFQSVESNGDYANIINPTDVSLLSTVTMATTDISGADGLSEKLRLFQGTSTADASRVIDATCSNDSNKLLFVFWQDTGGLLNKGRLKFVVWPTPLTLPISQAVITGPTDATNATFTANAINSLESVGWSEPTSTLSNDFTTFVIAHTPPSVNGATPARDTLRMMSLQAAGVGVNIADYDFVTETGTKPFYGYGARIFNAVMTYTKFNGTNWVLLQKATNTSAATTMATFARPLADPMDGVVVKQSVFTASGFHLVNGDGVLRTGTAASTLLTTFTTGAAFQPAIERANLSTFSWLSATQGNRFVLDNNPANAAALTQDYRYPVDTTRPVRATGQTTAGSAVVVYHTLSFETGPGVVVGRSDNAGCFNN
jgi:hypothetical protein